MQNFSSKGLTEAQRLHNRMLDFEIEEARRDNENVTEMNRLKMKIWEQRRHENPEMEQIYCCLDLDLRAPRKVIGIRYVE